LLDDEEPAVARAAAKILRTRTVTFYWALKPHMTLADVLALPEKPRRFPPIPPVELT